MRERERSNFLKIKLYFEKVVESHAVLRNNTKIPGASLTQLPQWLHLAKL